MVNRRIILFLFCVLILLSLIQCSSAVITYTAQESSTFSYGWNGYFTEFAKSAGCSHLGTRIFEDAWRTYGGSDIYITYLNMVNVGPPLCGTPATSWSLFRLDVYAPLNVSTDYFAFTVHPATTMTYNQGYIYAGFYNAAGTTFNGGVMINDYMLGNKTYNRYEILRYSNTAYLYIDGNLIRTGDSVTSQPYNIGFRMWNDGVARAMQWSLVIDDVSVVAPLTDAECGIISTIPTSNTYVLKNLSSLSQVGAYFVNNGTQFGNLNIHTSYSCGSIGSSNPTYGSIVTRHQASMLTANTTSLSLSSNTSGIVTYNLSTMLFDANKKSGVYEQQLYYGATYAGTTYFMYIHGDGLVSADKDIYNKGDTAIVTTTLSGSYSYSDYDFYLKVHNMATGDVVSTTSITTNTTTSPVYLNPSLVEAGTYYASLIATRKSNTTDYYLGYDMFNVTMVDDTSSFTGGISHTFQDNYTFSTYYTVSGNSTMGNTTSGTPEIRTISYNDNFNAYIQYGYTGTLSTTGNVNNTVLITDTAYAPMTYYAFTNNGGTIELGSYGGTYTIYDRSMKGQFLGADLVTPVGSTNDLDAKFDAYNTSCRWEFFRYGTTLYTYIDGVLNDTATGFSSNAYGFRFKLTNHFTSTSSYSRTAYFNGVLLDNVEYNSPYGGGVVSTIPNEWYVYRDFLDPAISGIICSTNGTLMSSDSFTTTYAVGSNMDGYNAGINITTENIETGVVFNTTTKTMYEIRSDPVGIIRYSARDVLINQSAPSGLYKQTMFHGAQEIGYTVFSYISGGGSILWDRSTYNVGDSATITSGIGASFDPGAYDYYGKVYNLDGELKRSWEITLSSQIETFSIDAASYPEGVYFTQLVATRTADGETFVMGYDIAEIYEIVAFSGYTWDAVDAVKLGEVNVGAYQLDEWTNTTSDVSSAWYQILELMTNSPVMFNASKEGYNHTPIYIIPLLAQDYATDLYLIQNPLPFNGTGIGGLVLTSNYKQAIENVTVTLSNNTWSGTRNTSITGWYLFDSSPVLSDAYEELTTEVIDTTYDMGKYSAIAHNGTMLHVAYYDNTNQALIGAYKNTVWHPEITDSGNVTLYDNYVYVADSGNNRIVMRDSNLIYIDKIGSLGSGDDEFNGTIGLTTLRNVTMVSNYLYIADTNNSRIEKRFANNLTFVDAFGTYGTGDDNFSSPMDVCVDGDGVYMWVADTGNHRIVQRFAGNYTYVNQYGTYGTGTTNFSSPQGVGTETTGTYLLVTDTGNSRIMKFFAQNLTYIDSVGSVGTTDNKFNNPRSSTIERSGEDVFYVADTGNNRIMARKLSDLTYLRKIGTLGTGADQFNAPTDITSDGVYVYVADSGNNRIHKRYASDFIYATMIGSLGSGDDQFNTPSGVTVSLNGSTDVHYDVGEYASLTLDTAGNEWVSFYDATNGDLMTAHRHPGSEWHSYRSDSGGDVGQYTSNANYGDMVQVSYYNVTGQNLKYMTGNVSGNYTEIVDWGVGTGKYSGIALTGGGEPRISYYDETNGDLKYASKTGYTWTNTTVDSTDNVGQYTDIYVDGSGYAYISYYDVSNANLKFANRNSTGWHTETIDATGDVGKYTSITRSETTGYIYISYYDMTNGNLKMAYHNTREWTIVTIDSSGNVGSYTSIDLDISGYPHISYYDETNNQLKHAYYYLTSTETTELAPLTNYTITATKNGYMPNTSSISAPSYGNYTLFDIFMNEYYNLTVNVIAADSNTHITTTCLVALSDGQSTNTTTGIAYFDAIYGSYTVAAAATGYYTNSTSVVLDTDKTVNIYMTTLPPDYSSTIDYTIAPRNVRFICVDHFGQRLKNVEVSAVGYGTTLPDWGILNVVFGWLSTYTNASMSNDTMIGTTGDDGSVVFLMTESLQYNMDFNETTRGIHETLTLYPKDDTYIITLGTSPFAEPDVQYINISLYTSEPNTTATTLWASYNDPNLHTTSANFTVRNASGYVLYSHITSGSNAFTDSYTVSHVTGTQYTWGIIAVQTDYGNISRYASTTLHSRLIELGLEDMYYNWISLIFLFILIGLFSGRSVIYGYVVFPLVMGVFYFIGWLQVSYLLASGVIILGIMLFLSKRQFQGEGV